MYVNFVKHKKSYIFSIQIYFGTVLLRWCMCVCVRDTCLKYSICFKSTIKKPLNVIK